MVVKEILLEKWGPFRDQKRLELSEDLNLVVGPNEAGKSIIVEALRFAFFDKHTTRFGRIEEFIPWGSGFSPKVSVVFETNGEQFRITKKFISSPSSILEKLVKNRWESMTDGDDADRRVIELIGGRLPGRGPSKPEHWGLTQILWARQGEILPEGWLNEETKIRIQRTAGAIITPEKESKVRERVRSAFNEIFTPARRVPKVGSELDSVQKEINDKEDLRTKLEQKLTAQEKLAKDIIDAEEELAQEKDDLRQAKKRLEDAENELKEANKHERTRLSIDSDVKSIQRDYNDLRGKIEQIESLEKQLRQGQKQAKKIESQLKLEEETSTKIAKELEDKQGCLENLKGTLSDKQENLRIARQVHDTLRYEIDLAEVRTKLKKVSDLLGRKKKIETQLGLLKAPTQDELDSLRKLKESIDKKKTQLEAIGLSARLTADKALKGAISSDGETKEFTLATGSTREWKASQRIVLELHRIAEFAVSSRSKDVGKLTKELEELENEYVGKTAIYETGDISKLEEKSRKRGNLEKDLAELNTRLGDLAPGGSKELEEETKKKEQHIERNWSKIPKDSPFLQYKAWENKEDAREDVAKKLESLEKEIGTLTKDEAGLNAEVKKLIGKKEFSREQMNKLNLNLRSLFGESKQMQKQLQELKNDGTSDAEKKEKLKGIGYELERKKEALKRLEEERAEKEEKPKKKYEETKRGYDNLQETVVKRETLLSNLRGQLHQLSLEGTYSDLAKLEEELQDLKRRDVKLKEYAQAIGLLYDLDEFYRRRTLESVLEPITKMVSDNLKRLAGPRYGKVKLSEDFIPGRIEVPDWGAEANWDVLSYGTKQQLAFLIRLALGEVLSKEERQLVVLDDPLTDTYVTRLKPALEILREASKKMQLVVLTCHPSQYSELADANMIRM